MNRNPDMPVELVKQIQEADQALQQAIRLAQEASFSSNTRIETELHKVWLRLRRILQTAASAEDMDMRRTR